MNLINPALNKQRGSQGDDYEEMPLKLPMVSKPRFLSVSRDKYSGHVVVDVRGNFPSDPHEITEELQKLRHQASVDPVVEVHIRSDGGSVYTMIELIEALRKYKQIITFGYAGISSAGAFTWSIGDIRVLAKHSYVMFHRESFGSYGKVPEHRRMVDFIDDLYAPLIADCDFLTDEEKEQAKHDEVYLSANEIFGRGIAISNEQYESRGEMLNNVSTHIINLADGAYLVSAGMFQKIKTLELEGDAAPLVPDFFNKKEEEIVIDSETLSEALEAVSTETEPEPPVEEEKPTKPRRGRPRGSKNKPKTGTRRSRRSSN